MSEPSAEQVQAERGSARGTAPTHHAWFISKLEHVIFPELKIGVSLWVLLRESYLLLCSCSVAVLSGLRPHEGFEERESYHLSDEVPDFT